MAARRSCAPSNRAFIGVGPQIGDIFPAEHNMQGYLNLKAYGKFDNANRLDGWNVWLTFSLSPAPSTAEAAEKPMVIK